MSLRLEMLQVARLAPQLLGESTELVRTFLDQQLDDAGGFRDRSGRPDLYYTVFGLDGLHALAAEVPSARVAAYLRSFGDGEGLDLVHLACLARAWAALPDAAPGAAERRGIVERLGRCRAADGGYAGQGDGAAAAGGTVYGTFVACGALQDLGAPVPDDGAVAGFVAAAASPDGSFRPRPAAPPGEGTTPVTAAAATLLRYLGRPVAAATAQWLADRAHPQGGFRAAPGAPMPDLLSTATALHALAGLELPLAPLAEPCLDFVDSLWTNRGAFHGHWADDEVDCEYTFYGLLALGHLSVYLR